MGSLLYFFWISITVSLSLAWILRRADRQHYPMNLIFNFTGWSLLIAPLGARLLHVLYESPNYYIERPWQVFAIWQGGFVYYGGLLALLVFSIFYFRLRAREKTFYETADLLTPGLCFGTGFGRVACFLQSCCYGREWDGWLAFEGRHPTQLYILAWEFLLLGILLRWEKTLSSKPGRYFLTWIFASALGRFLIEFYREDFRGQFIIGLSISQLISFGIMVGAFICRARLKNSNAKVLTGKPYSTLKP